MLPLPTMAGMTLCLIIYILHWLQQDANVMSGSGQITPLVLNTSGCCDLDVGGAMLECCVTFVKLRNSLGLG